MRYAAFLCVGVVLCVCSAGQVRAADESDRKEDKTMVEITIVYDNYNFDE